ncbi:kinetochore-associated Ndc80 complex subunit ndc80 [Kickxella alabastrina]|uniref:Kinetochore-associated Ndc80 complex subunit ndc80 n=1 Tax=Kickxella alabastrina TaxID=61397 RepID=A0ACC1IW86_9FUNG|nr:kinetochore-associated Ndc80 complex subunit ndc80 [Kickxella alabastrina]
MNARRRTTMNIGEGSGIPQPSLLRAPRASMAPSMFAQGMAPPSLAQTTRKPEEPAASFAAQTPARGARGGFGGNNNPPMSHARNNAAAVMAGVGGRFVAQTPATNRINRRVTVFASARRVTMNIAVPGTVSRNGGGVKDPRPIKERAYQAKAQQRIISFLSTHGYQGILTPKTLATPTVKEFQTIFRFLYAQLDPRYVYGYQKKFEDDALHILRGIHYPYVGNISKSHIYSAGSMSTWPGLLAMLLWMVELIECVTQMNPQDIDINNPEFKDSAQFVDRVFFDYLSQAYPVWLDSGEEPAELESILANQFEQKNANLIQETAEIERRLANAKTELEALQSNESPLIQLDGERVELILDKAKFEQFIQKLEGKHQRMADYVGNQKQVHDAAQVEQMTLEKEKAEVKVIVDAQQISTEDVDRMNSERNQLLETLKGVQEKLQEATNIVWDREMRLQRVLDDVETLGQDYVSKAHKLGLIGNRKSAINMASVLKGAGSSNSDEDVEMADANANSGLPDSAKSDPLGGVDIELVVDTHAVDRQKITSVDLRRHVWPALQRACDVYASQLHATQSSVLELREKMDQLSESRMEQDERVEEMDKQAKRHNQRYYALREIIMNETRAATAQIGQLEADIAAMRRDISQGELQSKAALTHAEAEWESVQRGCRMRRAEINEDVVTILEDVVQMQSHSQDRLKELLQLVSEDAEAASSN